jgi:Asp-tRNA(Asn)/Glu-tRNA(Gln) amidotransferase A subunit family amidase
MSVPAGFTDDGLPVGMEILGKPFDETTLVELGYSFEQTGDRRQSPETTPPL